MYESPQGTRNHVTWWWRDVPGHLTQDPLPACVEGGVPSGLAPIKDETQTPPQEDGDDRH
jgi:hypothetical protein